MARIAGVDIPNNKRADTLLCKKRICLSYSLAPAGIFKTTVKNDLLDHPSHLSVSTDKKFHISYLFTFL